MGKNREINKIIKDQYGNYNGRLMKPHKTLHEILRRGMGDKAFLEFLIKETQRNPRPKYKLPQYINND